MKRTIAVVSTVIDATIGEFFRDTVIETYISLQHLAAEVTETPKRIQKLIVVSDVVIAAPSAAFNTLINILNNSFFKADQIVYITPAESKEQALLDYLITEGKLPQIDVFTGEVTREFILSVVRGTFGGNGLQTRVAVTRRRAADFLADELAKKKGAKPADYLDNTSVIPEEEAYKIAGISSVKFQPAELSNAAAEIIQIVGAQGRGKTTFLLLLAELLSLSCRCVLVENDLHTFSLSAYLRYSGIQFTEIPLSMIYSDPKKAISMARRSQMNLICFTGESSMKDQKYSKPFLNRFVYNMLNTDVSYIFMETTPGEMLPAVKSIMVLNNDLISILKDIEEIPYKPANLRFIALAKGTIQDIQIQSSEELTALLSQLLSTEIKPVPIYQITSLMLGDEVVDMNTLVI